MRPIGLSDAQTALVEAFEDGLRNKYGAERAQLYRRVIEYRPHVPLDETELRRSVELDSAPVLTDIVANTVTAATLGGLRSLIVGSALLDDKAAVVRWATEGLNHSQTGTTEWRAILNDPAGFIQLARQIKYFLNQI